MFSGERANGNGIISGFFLIWNDVPVILEYRNGAVIGHEVIVGTLARLNEDVWEGRSVCTCEYPDTMFSVCHCGKVLL